jgi:hypothetical protein
LVDELSRDDDDPLFAADGPPLELPPRDDVDLAEVEALRDDCGRPFDLAPRDGDFAEDAPLFDAPDFELFDGLAFGDPDDLLRPLFPVVEILVGIISPSV